MVFNYNPSVTTWPRSVVSRLPLQRREVLRTHLCSATLGVWFGTQGSICQHLWECVLTETLMLFTLLERRSSLLFYKCESFGKSEKKCSSLQLCPTLCNIMDCNPPGSSVRGIFQARRLEWVAISFSRGSFQTRDQTHVPGTGRQVLYR